MKVSNPKYTFKEVGIMEPEPNKELYKLRVNITKIQMMYLKLHNKLKKAIHTK